MLFLVLTYMNIYLMSSYICILYISYTIIYILILYVGYTNTISTALSTVPMLALFLSIRTYIYLFIYITYVLYYTPFIYTYIWTWWIFFKVENIKKTTTIHQTKLIHFHTSSKNDNFLYIKMVVIIVYGKKYFIFFYKRKFMWNSIFLFFSLLYRFYLYLFFLSVLRKEKNWINM